MYEQPSGQGPAHYTPRNDNQFKQRPPRRGLAVAIIAVAAFIALGGASAVLAATGVLGTWFGGADTQATVKNSQSATGGNAGAAEPEPYEFGIAQKWSTDLKPGMRLSKVPVQFAGGVVVERQAVAGDGARATLYRTSDGEQLWDEATTITTCELDPLTSGAACSLQHMLGAGPTEVVFLDAQGETSRFEVPGFRALKFADDGESLWLSNHDGAIHVDREGNELPSNDPDQKPAAPVTSLAAPESNLTVPLGVDTAQFDESFRTIEVRQTNSEKVLLSQAIDPIAGATAAWGGPDGVLITSTCVDCVDSTTGSLSRLTFLAEGDEVSSAVRKVATEVPAEIPDCPEPTVLLAWAQFTKGWVLICGYDGQPSYLAVQLPGETSPRYSAGQSDPTSQGARDAVKWDEHLERYTAVMESGDFFVLENDTGTTTLWPSETMSGEPSWTEWVVRIFVPLHDRAPRTLRVDARGTDPGQSSGPQVPAEEFAIPACDVLNPAATRATGVAPHTVPRDAAKMYGPVVRGALQQASRVAGCAWEGKGTVMQWVAEVTPEQKNALIDGMLDFGYRAEADGPLLRVSFSEPTSEGLETHTHVFDGDAWLFIYQLGSEGDFEEAAKLTLAAANPGRFE
ncbi:hypothetical protein ACXR2T_02220 [Leucobacter sp. HY1910]